MSAWESLEHDVIGCERCPRLRNYCADVARVKKRSFQDDLYWARPVPGFGDRQARVMLVGLAPAAHGANRTGRMFTGDGNDGWGAADFLMRGLHLAGFANRATSRSRDDGLVLTDLYLTAIVRCAPPDNKPTPGEIKTCSDYLLRELELLPRLTIILALGQLAYQQVARLLLSASAQDLPTASKRRVIPKFAHGVRSRPIPQGPQLWGSYHPSRQNTQTGRLTAAMFHEVLVALRAESQQTS